MAIFILQIPKAYSARVGGNGLQSINVTVEAATPMQAKQQAVKYGIPSGAFQLPKEIKGGIVSGSLPTNLRDIPNPYGGNARDAGSIAYGVNPANTAVGANQFTRQPTKELEYYADGSVKSTGQSPAIRRDASGRMVHGSTEQSSGTNFAPNVNPPKTPTQQQIQGALPFEVGGVDDPFYNPQPPTYKRMTPEDFRRIRQEAATSQEARGQTGRNAAAAAAAAAKKAAAEAAAKKAAAEAGLGFNGTLAAIKSGEISLYSDGTFDLTPFEDPEFWDAVFEDFDFAEGLEGDTRAAMLDAMARQIAASAGDNSFEAKKAVKEFYKQAERQANSRGLGDLSLSDGRTLNTFAFAHQKAKQVEEVANTNQEEADADLAKSKLDLDDSWDPGMGGSSERRRPDLVPNVSGDRTAFDSSQLGGNDNFTPIPESLPARTPNTGQNGMTNIQDIIDSFEQVNGMPPTSEVPVMDADGVPAREPDVEVAGIPASLGQPATDPYTKPGAIIYETVVNPLLATLLDMAETNNGFVSDMDITNAQAESQVEVAELRKEEALGVAYEQGVSASEIATIQREGDYDVAIAQQAVDKHIANQQLVGTQAQAAATAEAAKNMATGQTGAAQFAAGAASPFGFMQQAVTNDALQTPEQQLAAIYGQLNQVGLAEAGATEAAAESARLGQTAAASSMAGGERAAAQAAAAAASPFGFMSQNYNQASRDADLKSIYAEINKVGLAQAQDNPYGYAAGQVDAFGNREFRPNELAQIGANTPAAFAARGQEAAASQQATGFGALSNLAFGDPRSGQVRQILQAQAANNPYAATQLGQNEARIDQILRGGLNPEQRLAEINASQSGQNQANFLNFIGNPSAVGFATEQGLFGGGNNQVLQDINNSPEGNVPGSLFGLNSPSAAGAGGNQMTNTGNSNPNLSTMRGWSDEKIGFEQGMASARGQTPSKFRIEAESFTPQGVG